VEVYSR